MSHLPVIWIVVLLHLTSTFASPIFAPQFLPGGTGRNIRHLPCVSLRSGETGVCMFAFTCVKSNGTHLGTCIDRFYFGSCCKLNEEVDVYPQDNTIEDASAASSFVTTGSVQESNDIPDYFTRPKPVVEKEPESSTTSSIGQTVSATKAQTAARMTTTTTTTTTTARPTTTRAVPKTTQKIVTKRPTFFSTPYTTTQPPIGLSTFQTLYDYSHGSGSSTSSNHRPVAASRPTTANKNATTTETSSSTSSATSGRPGASTSSISQASSTITKKPSSTRPSVTRRPISTSTTRPTVTTTERTSTRFPPRNATTTNRPQHTTNTRKPVQHSTKKPSSTTRRPSPATRRPTTTKQPIEVSTSRPISTTEKTTTTNLKVTQTSRPPPLTSTQETPTMFPAKTSSPTRPTQRPIVTGPSSTTNLQKQNTTSKPTTSKPTTISGRPRPSSKPTRPSMTSSVRPTTTKTTQRPQQVTTERIGTITSTPTPSTLSSFSYTKPSSFKPTSGASLKPKPSEKPSKPSKPSPTTTTPASTTSITPEASTLSLTSLVFNDTTLANEVLPPKVPAAAPTTEKISPTTQPPNFVTWSSNSDENVTKAPLVSSSTSETTHQASTDPEWSPITTPDGWIMIQSPTTEKTPIEAAQATRPETTKFPTTSAKPSTESATTESSATTRPTLPAMLSTIATVTAATDLPVPTETLNMSDYNQVCGRRLFPESRIVGGEHSSFGKWPWQISLRQWRTAAYLHKCGAALLNENWAITAAHCVEYVPPSDLLLRIGEHDLANENEPYGFQERRVQIVASHPQFDPRTFEYDLALLRFYEPVLPFQPNLLPICLPDDDENYVGHTAYVTGWGRLYEDGPLPSALQEVSVPVVNNTVCEGMYRNAGFSEHIPHIFICAGWRKGGFDSCEGDSGGPMVIQRPRDKRWILAGVISWGIGCAAPNQPGVYTRISEFREWINQILQF